VLRLTRQALVAVCCRDCIVCTSYEVVGSLPRNRAPARATHLQASSQTARPMAVRTTAVAQHSATRLSAAHRLAARPLAHRPPPAGPPRTRGRVVSVFFNERCTAASWSPNLTSHRWNCPRFVAPATWRALARADSGSCLRVAAALRSRCHLLPRLTTPTTLLPPGA
jgi:hypothetical protein